MQRIQRHPVRPLAHDPLAIDPEKVHAGPGSDVNHLVADLILFFARDDLDLDRIQPYGFRCGPCSERHEPGNGGYCCLFNSHTCV